MVFFKRYSSPEIIIKITCVAWLLGKVLTLKLWLSNRSFPIIPSFDFIPKLPNFVHLFLLITSFFLLILIFFYTKKTQLISVFLIAEIASCSLDLMRWQPWEYQYILMFFIFLFSNKKKQQFQKLIAFLLIGTYFYSGLHKLNGAFLYSFWERLILIKLLHIPKENLSNSFLHYSGLILAFIEIIIGLGVFLSKYKRFFAVQIIVMHILIILILSPIGLNHNSVVIPWNIAMILFVYVLYFRDVPPIFTFEALKNKLTVFIFITVAMLPALNFIGLWDNYLSFNLYSGNLKYLSICFKFKNNYPEINTYLYQKQNIVCEGRESIHLINWSQDELNVPFYPEDRFFIAFKKEFNAKYPKLKSEFVIYKYPFYQNDYKKI